MCILFYGFAKMALLYIYIYLYLYISISIYIYIYLSIFFLSPVSEEGSFINPKYILHWLHWTVGVISVFLLSYYIYRYIYIYIYIYI